MAEIVWHQHYDSIVGCTQITYMLEKFQSETAIKSQLAEKYSYFILSFNGKDVGYYSITNKDEGLLISKIYVMPEYQGRGFGSLALDYIKENTNVERIWLTVNKMNKNSIGFYRKNSFAITDEIVTDIGSGFVMDDFIMEFRC